MESRWSQFIEMAKAGKSYEEIKAGVKQLDGITKEELIRIMKRVDNEFFRIEAEKNRKYQSNVLLIAGAVVLLFGIGITGFTMAQGGSSFVLAYGAILSGLSTMLIGYIRGR